MAEVDLRRASTRRFHAHRAEARNGVLGSLAFPAGDGAIQVIVHFSAAPARTLRFLATDEAGCTIAAAFGFGEESILARLAIPVGPARRVTVRIDGVEDGTLPPVLDARLELRLASDPDWLGLWSHGACRWRGNALEVIGTGELLRSPLIDTTSNRSGEIEVEAVATASVVIGVWLRNLDRQEIVAGRYWQADGHVRGVTPFRDLLPGRYHASLVAERLSGPGPHLLQALDLRIRGATTEAQEPTEPETSLPHWGPIGRRLHRWCKRSGAFNSFVQGIEFRLGREEMISLPRYMSFCPTGQCNALCDFCSVTVNRTGIVKRQIDADLVERFTAPARRTVALYGLEGNGEPTLHKDFPALAQALTASKSEAYLITNGSRFSEDLLPMLIRLESVNVSLNAATAKTHQAVMKLKESYAG
jgi:hypothetical protein